MSQVYPRIAPRRFRLASPATALAAAAVVLALMIAEFPLASRAHQSVGEGGGGAPLWFSAPFGVIGFLVAYRKPGNRLGWILIGLAGSLAVAEDASFFAMGTVWMASAFSFTVGAITRHDIHVDSSGNLQVLSHPTGSAAWWGAVQNAVIFAIAVCWLVSLVGQAVSYRRSSGQRRQQLKWLMGGSVAALAGLFLSAALSSRPGLPSVISHVGLLLAIFALPMSMGVAILKYRLYDIDRLISRTLAYAIVTGLLVGVYTGLVLLATQGLRLHTPVAVAAATLAAAALFNPVRRRVQRGVDRRFNRARYDADETVAAFAARLKDAVELDAVRADLAGVVQQALEPAHITVWTSRPG